MSALQLSERVKSLTTAIPNALSPRTSVLKGWEAALDPDMDYSHGLDGVDQKGNSLWVTVLVYLFLFIGLATLFLHVFNMCYKQMRHLSVMGEPTKQSYWKDNKTTWWPWINRHILAAPLIRKRHNRGFQLSSAIDNGTLPGRWHTIVLVTYCALNIAWTCILPTNEGHEATVAALRGRSGTLAALNLIPTILFALRNNPLIPLLQVSYDDFNLFHRWAARITIVEAIVHTCAWMYNTVHRGGWAAFAAALQTEESYTWGMVGTVAMILIGIQAWSPIRHAFYETFLNIHRVSVVFALVGIYLHLEKHGLPQLPWMHVVVAMWAVEVLLRFIRIWYSSVRLSSVSRIKIEAMPGEACRVTIDLQRPWVPRPGCHAHLYIPMLNLPTPWTSHPFSIAWSPVSESHQLTSKDASLPSTLESQSAHVQQTSTQISLICRARTGFTRKMYLLASAAPHKTLSTIGLLEGPYGGHHSLDSFGTVLLFAGGVGITHQTMYIQHLVNTYHAGTSAIQRLVLIWTVPESECLEWVRPWMDAILRSPSRKQVLSIKLFITRPKRRVENSESSSVAMFAGRPNTSQVVRDEFERRVGSMCVTVCGSGAFADEVRGATRDVMPLGDVEFIEEAFTY